MNRGVMSVPVSLVSTAVMLTAVAASVSVLAARSTSATVAVAVREANDAGAVATTLRVPDRANATPWIAASGDFVAVAWGASAAAKMADVYVAVSRDGGRTFSAPVQVNKIAGEGRLGGELPPRVSLVRRSGVGPGGEAGASSSVEPEIFVLWNARGTVTSIKMSRSRDGGKSFDAPVTLSSADAIGDRGWPSLTVDGRGTPHAIWVDHRGLAAARCEGATHAAHQSGGTHQHGAAAGPAAAKDATAAAGAKPAAGANAAAGAGTQGSSSGGAAHGNDRATHDGVAMAQKSGLYYASLPASGAATGPAGPVETQLTAGTCYCCKTALVTGRDDVLYAAWRHVYPGNLRDIAFSVSRDHGRTFSAPVRVSEDHWEIHGCPDDGPAMTVDKSGTVHVIWPTVIGGGTDGPQGALFYASTSDGRTFTPRVRIPTLGSPKPSHPQIVSDDRGRLIVAWDEIIDGQRTAVVRELHRSTAGRPVTFGDPLRLTTTGLTTTGLTTTGLTTTAASATPSATAGRAAGAATAVAPDAAAPSTYPVLASTSRGLLAVWTSGASGASVIAIKQIDLPAPTATTSR